jgi:hypothetical protein
LHQVQQGTQLSIVYPFDESIRSMPLYFWECPQYVQSLVTNSKNCSSVNSQDNPLALALDLYALFILLSSGSSKEAWHLLHPL